MKRILFFKKIAFKTIINVFFSLFLKILIQLKFEMLNFDYLNNLNEKQKEAVTYLNGPLLIVAGAGSGKTKVLTSRISHIIPIWQSVS